MCSELDKETLGAFEVPEPSADLEDRVWAAHAAPEPVSQPSYAFGRAVAVGGALALAIAAFATGYALRGSDATQTEPIPERLSLAQLDRVMRSEQIQLIDANPAVIREAFGSIEGSIQLQYTGDEASLENLPADKEATLIFYSANETCPYAPRAADRAIVAGYRDVHILPAGIIGWTEAGRPVVSKPRL